MSGIISQTNLSQWILKARIIWTTSFIARMEPINRHHAMTIAFFLGGAASSDESSAPEWLINPETTDDDKRPLNPRAVLDWWVNLPSKYSDGAIFVMFSFSYDVTHILRHLRFDRAWQIFKKEKYDKDRTKRLKIRSRVFCGELFDEFVMKYRNRKQLDIWKLRDPAHPYLLR